MNITKILIFLIFTTSTIGLSKPVPYLYRSGYYLGRGDTGISTADNHEAIFYNPAGIATGKGIYKEVVIMSPTAEISADTKDLVRQVVVEKKTDADTIRQHIGKNQHFGIYNFTGVVFRRVAFGMINSAQGDAIVSKSYDDGGLEKLVFSTRINNGIVLSLAESFFSENMYFGTTIKYLQNQSADLDLGVVDSSEIKDKFKEIEANGNARGIDLGYMYRSKGKTPFSLGLTIMDLGDTKFSNASDNARTPDPIKQTINLGLSIAPGTKHSRFEFFFDYRDLASTTEKIPFKKIHIGTEISFRKFIGFTAGLNQGYPSLGVYMNLYVFRLDIGGYGEEVGEHIGSRPDQRYFLKLFAGF